MSTPKPLNCRQVRRVINQFLDGELPSARHHLVIDHLEVCDMCGIEATKIEAVLMGLRTLQSSIDPAVATRLDSFAERVGAGEMA